MTNAAPALEIRKSGRSFFIYAGVSKLSHGFKTQELAAQWGADNHALLSYWAGSASVSIENAEWREIWV